MTVLETLNAAASAIDSNTPADLTFTLHLVVKDENSYTLTLASKAVTITNGLTGTANAKVIIPSAILIGVLSGKILPKSLLFNSSIQVTNFGALKSVVKWFNF